MSAVSVETNPRAGYVGTKTADHQAQYGTHYGEREWGRLEKQEQFSHVGNLISDT